MAEHILRTDDRAETKYNITIYVDSLHGITIPVNKFGVIIKDVEGKELGRLLALNGAYDFLPSEESQALVG